LKLNQLEQMEFFVEVDKVILVESLSVERRRIMAETMAHHCSKEAMEIADNNDDGILDEDDDDEMEFDDDEDDLE